MALIVFSCSDLPRFLHRASTTFFKTVTTAADFLLAAEALHQVLHDLERRGMVGYSLSLRTLAAGSIVECDPRNRLAAAPDTSGTDQATGAKAVGGVARPRIDAGPLSAPLVKIGSTVDPAVARRGERYGERRCCPAVSVATGV